MRTKKLISVFLMVIMIFSIIFVPFNFSHSFAEEADDTSKLPFSGAGEGTAYSPYVITNAEQLMEINNDLDAYYVLQNDIDISDYTNWIPIGLDSIRQESSFYEAKTKYEKYCFKGTLDGYGHKIIGLNYDYKLSLLYENIGLFFCLDKNACIKNIVMEEVDINLLEDAYNLDGSSYSIAPLVACKINDTNTVIKNCQTYGNISVGIDEEISSDITYYRDADLEISGIGNADTIEKCTNKIDISVVSSSCEVDISGIGSSTYLIKDSVNYGDIYVKQLSTNLGSRVGGVSDYCYDIKNCINYGDIDVLSHDAVSVGGIGGAANSYSSRFDFCINYGNVKCNAIQVPASSVTNWCISLYVGGILGNGARTNFNNCCNMGNVSAVNSVTSHFAVCYIHVGGIVGDGGIGVLQNCVSAGNVYGEKKSGCQGYVSIATDSDNNGDSFNNYHLESIDVSAYDAGNLIYLYNDSQPISLEQVYAAIARIKNHKDIPDFSTAEEGLSEESFDLIYNQKKVITFDYTSETHEKLEEGIKNIKIEYDQDVFEISEPKAVFGTNDVNALVIVEIIPKKVGNFEFNISMPGSTSESKKYAVNVEPELILSEGQSWVTDDSTCDFLLDCNGFYPIEFQSIDFDLTIDEPNAEYLENFLESIAVSTQNSNGTSMASYEISYNISDDAKSAQLSISVTCVDDNTDDYISIKTPAQSFVLRVTRNKSYTKTGYYSPANFLIGRDNNSFAHAKSENGFFGRTDHMLTDASYYKKLTQNSNDAEKIKILSRMAEEWHGSCYGIALSIALVHQKYLSVSDISSTDGLTSYFELIPDLNSNEKFYNMLEYFYLSQFLEKGGKSAIVCENYRNFFVNAVNNFSSLKTVLKCIVDKANSGKPFLLSFGVDGSNLGHTVVVLGVEKTDNYYNIVVYDENDTNKIGYKFMSISSDYSTFNCSDYGFNTQNYKYLQVVGLDLMKGTPVLSSDIKNIGLKMKSALLYDIDAGLYSLQTENETNDTEDLVYISFYADQSFRLINSEGKKLEYCNEALSGDIEVVSVSTNISNDKIMYSISIKPDSGYTVENIGDNFGIEMSNQDMLFAVQSNKMDKFTLDFEKGLAFEGNDYDFGVKVGMVDGDEPVLLSVSGVSDKNLVVDNTSEQIVFKPEGSLDDVVIDTYVCVDKHENTYDSLTDNFTVDNEEAAITEVPESKYTLGDVNSDGNITAIDARLILQNAAENYEFDETVKLAADVNRDENVTAIDARLVLQAAAGNVVLD